MNYSGVPLEFPEDDEFELESSGAPDTVRWHTGQFGAPDQRCLRLPLCSFADIWNFFAFYFGDIWLCIPLGTTFEQKTYAALPYERIFVASSCSASPWGQLLSFSLLFHFFYLCTRWCMLRFYILHFLGDFALVELNKKGKITSYGPIKNLSPPLERKRVP